MNPFRVVGSVVQGWILGFSALRYGRVREPFIVIGGLQLVLLILVGHFHVPWLAGLLTPVVQWTGGEAATHYPEHFWRLPEIFRTTNAVLMAGFGIFAWSAAIAGYAGRRVRWRPAFSRASRLVPLAVLLVGLPWAITSAFNLIPVEIALRSSIIRLGLQMVELGLNALVFSLFACAPVSVMLEDRSLTQALGSSLRTARRLPLETLLVVLIPAGLLFPPTFFLFEMNLDQAGLEPEAVGLLLTGLLVVRVFFDALVIGALTALFLSRREVAR